MIICSKCGAQMKDNVKFCTECGNKTETPVQTVPIQAEPMQAVPMQAETVQTVPVQAVPIRTEPIQAAPPRVAAVQPMRQAENKPEGKYALITTGGFIGITLLTLIPVLGQLLLIIWALGGCKKKQKTYYARASLIMLIISIAFFAVIGFVAKKLITNFINNIKEELNIEVTDGWLEDIPVLFAKDKDNGDDDSSGLSQEEIDAADDAWNQLMEIYYTDEWRWYDDGSGYINGKWDHKVMYEPVPQPSENFVIEEMQFNSKQSTKWYDYCSIGEMYIDAADYEYISVSFECLQEDFDEFVHSFSASGWVVEDDSSEWTGYNYNMYYGGEYYAYLRANNWLTEDESTLSGTLSVLPAYYKRPEKVQDLPMPTFGFFQAGDYYNFYDKDYNWDDIEYPRDTKESDLGYYWCYRTDYNGCTLEDVKAYIRTLDAAGWKESYEDDSEMWFYSRVEKNGKIVQVSYEKGCNLLSIQFANNENLFY